jgi:hypothetical protein
MAISTYSNTQQALAYALSEMGEVMTLNAAGTAVSSVKAVDDKTPVLSAVTVAAAKTHVAAVHPALAAGKIAD